MYNYVVVSSVFCDEKYLKTFTFETPWFLWVLQSKFCNLGTLQFGCLSQLQHSETLQYSPHKVYQNDDMS